MTVQLWNASSALSADNTEAIILYGSPPSPCVRRCRITLLEKGIPFDEVQMDLVNMEQRSQAYLALNPNGFVPTLSHGEFVVYESSIINDYLEQQFPDVPLMPQGPYQAAKVKMWVAAEGAMAKLFRPLMYQRLMGPLQHISRSHSEAQTIAARYTDDPLDLAWESKVWHMQVLTPEQEQLTELKLYDWLDRVEGALHNKTYLVGERFSQAEISLYPRISMLDYLGLQITQQRYPNLSRWMEQLSKRSSFDASLTPEARKIQKLATGPLLPLLRIILQKSPQPAGILDKAFLWGLGRIVRKAQKVDALLKHSQKLRSLPLPRPAKAAITPRRLAKINQPSDERKVTLYADPDSPHSERIRYLLQLLQVDYDYQHISLARQEQLSAGYRQINPLAELPTLKHEQDTLFDSQVIAEYLLQQFDKKREFTDSDSQSAARQQMWLALESGSHKELRPLWQRHVLKLQHCQMHVVDEVKALQRVRQKLQRIEHQLQSTPFLCGHSIRFADLAWFTRLQALYQVSGFCCRDLPRLNSWHQRLEACLSPQSIVHQVHG